MAGGTCGRCGGAAAHGGFAQLGRETFAYGVASLNTALTMLIGKNLALMVSPLVPATYLAIGLTGTELKDHMKFSIPPYYLVSLLMLAFGVLLGIVTI